MGKIKSARELAMERTANLKEIRSAAGGHPGSEYEPYLKAARLLADSFLKKESTVDKISETLDRYPAGAREEAIYVLLKNIAEGMTVENIPETTGFWRRHRSGSTEGLIEEIERLGRRYDEQVGELRSAAESGKNGEKLQSCLLQEGIAGSAVAGVNLERSPWWRERLNRLQASLAPQLDRLKEGLLSALQK